MEKPVQNCYSSCSERDSDTPDCSSVGFGHLWRGLIGLELGLVLVLGDHLGDRGFRLSVLSLRGSGGLGLGGFESHELLLGRKLPALRDDQRLHLDLHVLEERDRDRVATDPLDRVDVHLSPVDPNLPRAPDLVRDISGRDGAEQRARGSRLDLEAENRLPEHLGDLLRLLGASCLVLRTLGLDSLELGHAGRRRHLGQAARQEVVAGVPARDVDDVPAQPELLDVLEQDELHRYWETYGRSAISRARFTAAATWS